MEDGKIVENGTHEELIKLDGYYRYLYEHQQEEPKDEQTASIK